MDGITMMAASGLRSRMQSLDLLGNNLANAATSGYKVDRESYSAFRGDEADSDFESLIAGIQPVIDRQWTDFTQGILEPTGAPLDFALSGSGFIAVDGPDGVLYTRGGHFHLDNTGSLVTASGYGVRMAGGGVLTVSGPGRVEVDPDGTVRQGTETLGRMEVVEFADPGALYKHSGTYFRSSNPAVPPKPATNTEVHQGRIEGSNVVVAEATVRMVGVMRQFEMLHKAISLAGEMNRKVVEEVAKVG